MSKVGTVSSTLNPLKLKTLSTWSEFMGMNGLPLLPEHRHHHLSASDVGCDKLVTSIVNNLCSHHFYNDTTRELVPLEVQFQ